MSLSIVIFFQALPFQDASLSIEDFESTYAKTGCPFNVVEVIDLASAAASIVCEVQAARGVTGFVSAIGDVPFEFDATISNV